MVNPQRPDDSIISDEPDTEGHFRAGLPEDTDKGTFIKNAGEDTEGHYRV